MFIIQLGQHQVILGKPWMKRHGVWPDTCRNNILFIPDFCDHAGANYAQNKRVPLFLKEAGLSFKASQLATESNLGPKLEPNLQPNLLFNLALKLLPKLPSISLNIAKPATESDNNSVPDIENRPFNISTISAAAYNYYLKNHKKEGTTLFYAIYNSLAEAADNLLKDYAEIAEIVTVHDDFIGETAIPEEVTDRLPEEYHEFRDVFDRSKADKLPPHREYDYKIELTSEGVPPRSRLYPMSGYKLQKLKDYIAENLGKGFIEPSKALYGSPILFALKSNGDLRLCVDYRVLNSITKRNRYPIPLINEVLARVAGYKYLTRLDIITAFNKLRISPESEDLITFVISLGAFKYKVIPFRLTNSPASY